MSIVSLVIAPTLAQMHNKHTVATQTKIEKLTLVASPHIITEKK